MSFQLRREVLRDAIEKGLEAIRIIPYYNYGVCIKIYEDNRHELWNYETIPISTVSKVVEYFLQKEAPTLKELYVQDKVFSVPKENIREALFDFLYDIELEDKSEENKKMEV